MNKKNNANRLKKSPLRMQFPNVSTLMNTSIVKNEVENEVTPQQTPKQASPIYNLNAKKKTIGSRKQLNQILKEKIGAYQSRNSAINSRRTTGNPSVN